MQLGQVSWPDIIVFLFFLAIQLLLRVGIVDTVVCAAQALPFLLLELPTQLVRERYLTPERRQLAFTRRSSLFQDVVIRCVRYAFSSISSDIGRVFFSKRVALPFLRFRLFRHGYIGRIKKRPGWKEVHTDGLKGLWIATDLESKPDVIIYYCHGGGMAMGSSYFYLEFLLAWVSLMAEQGFKNPAIFSLEYTLIPHKVYPHQLQETIAGYTYARKIAGDAARVVVGGDSAGAMLILSMLLYLGAKMPEYRPAFAVLISPWTHLVSKSHRNTAADFIDADTLHAYGRQYAGTEPLWDPLVSPGNCSNEAWWASSLPRKGVGFYYGSEEVFYENINILAKRLGKLGKVICRDSESIHAWPVAALFLEDTPSKRVEGLRVISKDIMDVLKSETNDNTCVSLEVSCLADAERKSIETVSVK